MNVRHRQERALVSLRTITTLLAVALLVGGPSAIVPPVAEASEHILNGMVIDRSGAPVHGALVAVGGEMLRTGPDGRFAVRGDPGPVTVSRPPFEDVALEWNGTSDRLVVTMWPRLIRSVHVHADAGADETRWQHILDFAEATALNSVMIDLKSESGAVNSPTPSGIAVDVGAARNRFDLAQRTAEAHGRGLYVITRIVTFQDPIAGVTRPSWGSIDTRTGRPFTRNGQVFLDPWDAGAREYGLTLAEDACAMGVDEVQFDYLRFLDGDKTHIRFDGPADAAGRTEAIRSFLEEAGARLAPMGCATAIDVFGFIVSKTHDGEIGQQLETIGPFVDVVSPMVYPSLYASGWFGFDVPRNHPAEVVDGALDDAQARLDGAPVLRPLLQDYSYTAHQVRLEIDQAEAHGVGWIMWNAYSYFTEAAYPLDGEVALGLPPIDPVFQPRPSSGFYDVPDGHTFAGDVAWLAATGITQGCNPPYDDEYCPDRSVTRAEMAAFLTRALDLPTGPATFDDVPKDHLFAADIAALSIAGITRGCNPPDNDRYCPDRAVTRAEMAAFLTRALDLPTGPAAFTDVPADHLFAADIAALSTARVTRGCNPPANDRYCPDRAVTRAEMAAFLRRSQVALTPR